MSAPSRRVFIICALANFLQSVAFSLFLHFPGFLKSELVAEEGQIGVVVALASLSALFSGPMIGRTMDRFGRLPVLRVGCVLAFVVFALYLQVEGLTPFLFFVRLLHGVAEGMLYAAFFTYAADHVPPARHAQGLALFGTSAMLAISVGGLLGDVLIAAGGYPAVFLAACLGGLGALVMTLPLRESWQPVQGSKAAPRRVLATLIQPNLRPLWLIAWSYFFAMAGVFTFLKTFVMETGFGSVGGFFAVYTTTAIVQRLTAGWVPDRLGLERVLGPSLVSFALGLTVLSRADQEWHLWVSAVCCGLGHGLCFPTLLALVTRRARPAERGTALALYATIDEGAVLVAGPVLGFLIEAAGYPVTFAVAAGGIGVALAILWRWDCPDNDVEA